MQNSATIKYHFTTWLFVITSSVLYLFFAYNINRTEYLKLVIIYIGLFVLFYKLIQTHKNNLKLLTWLAFAFRALFILAIPNLSQDFYRFIWDGRMILEGFNPYLQTPFSFISDNQFPITQAKELYDGMGSLSASHYTNYPPLNQLCFVLAGLFAGKSILGSVIVMRLLIIAADFGTIYFGKKLLDKLQIPTYKIFWYALNPFIIIELTGNLHFEGVMIFFLIWSLYLLYTGKWQWAAIVMACSVSVKLIPLLFLPLLYNWFMPSRPLDSARGNNIDKNTFLLSGRAKSRPNGFLKLIIFYIIVFAVTLVSFLPFYNPQFLINYTETVGLWFQNFEFNASIYYVLREIGYWITGYNQIAIIGKLTALLAFLFVMYLTFFKKNRTIQALITNMLLALTVYYFLSTTVHPWYVSTLLILSVFTNFRFAYVWSLVIILSYLAYLQIGNADKSENLWIIAFEYLIVFTVFLFDLKKANTIEN